MTAAAAPLPADSPTRVDYVALPVGSWVGRYEILTVLGQGGFGITYRARDSQLDREVALKEYLPAAIAVRRDGSSVLPRSTEAADDFDWGRSHFIDEGRILANLHEAPSIVRVFDFLETNGTAYIVMELLHGETLEERIKAQGPLTPAALETVLWPLLTGLQQVHETGFLHRDIKPANVMLGAADKATLIDFGASRMAMADRTKTMTAIFTPGFAAPEQFTAAKQGPWSDIYGLAATLHYAITGRAPPSAFDRLMKDSYTPLASLQPEGFSRDILAGIDAGLSIHFEQRPHSVAAWRALLHDKPIDHEETQRMAVPTQAPPMPAPPTPPTPPTSLRLSAPRAAAPQAGVRRHTVGIALALAICLPAMAGAYYLFAPIFLPATPPAESAATRQATIAAQPEREPTRPAAQAAPGEAEEMALKLTTADRQRIQSVLTSRGFDTRGTDGTFGPRSREMIAAWQRARKRPGTGYVTAADNLALREASPAAEPPPPQQLEGETTALAEPLPPQPPPTPPSAPPAVERFYLGSLSGSATGGGQIALAPLNADLRLVDRRLTGRLVHPVCGTLPVSLTVDGTGAVSGNLRLYESGGCATNAASASGRVGNGGTLTLDLKGIDVSFRGTLPLRDASSSGQRTSVP